MKDYPKSYYTNLDGRLIRYMNPAEDEDENLKPLPWKDISRERFVLHAHEILGCSAHIMELAIMLGMMFQTCCLRFSFPDNPYDMERFEGVLLSTWLLRGLPDQPGVFPDALHAQKKLHLGTELQTRVLHSRTDVLKPPMSFIVFLEVMHVCLDVATLFATGKGDAFAIVPHDHATNPLNHGVLLLGREAFYRAFNVKNMREWEKHFSVSELNCLSYKAGNRPLIPDPTDLG